MKIYIDEYIQSEEDFRKDKLVEFQKLLENKNNFIYLEKAVILYKKDFVDKVPKSIMEINQFWKKLDLQLLVDLKLETEEFNFKEYNFPEFNSNSFLVLRDNNGHIIFDKIAIFLRANFYGKAIFNKSFFKKKVNFNLVHFYDRVEMKSCRFEDKTYFRKAYFQKEVDFEASFFENVALDSITFPENEKIKMIRTSFDNVIWSNFINANDVGKIEAERETFSRLKQANSERGNFIDSNLFFVEESNIYLKNSWYKFFCIPSINSEDEDPNNKCPKISKKLGFLGDIISFGIAKYTTNFGQSWIRPLVFFFALFILGLFTFEPNVDFVSTETTPKFLMEEQTSLRMPKYNITDEYHKKNYYSEYVFDFQKNSNQKLIDNYTTRGIYVYGSLAPTLMSSSQWFSTVKEDKFRKRAILTILFWYFLGAFIYALKNRTRRV